jgi:hypothetical protein
VLVVTVVCGVVRVVFAGCGCVAHSHLQVQQGNGKPRHIRDCQKALGETILTNTFN